MRAEGVTTDPIETQPDLTARVRALYEESAVPVREIARLCGVTERTIYKYVQKHGWKNRYRWRGMKEGDTTRGRSWRPRQHFAAVKGAGGRFIRREERGKPVPQGLEATDPAARLRATAACGEAEHLARKAQAEAGTLLRAVKHARALAGAARALREYVEYCRAQKQNPGRPHPSGLSEEHLRGSLQVHFNYWRALQAEEERLTGE